MRSALLAGLLLTAALAPVAAQGPAFAVTARNPLDMARGVETVAVPWTTVTSRLAGATAARVRVLDGVSGAELVAQVLDADADGQPDSLLFQAAFGAREVRAFSIEAVAPAAAPRPSVHVKFVPEREDVAWESDRIAFRMYGKKLWELENLHSNGIDVWPKRTRALVLDRWYSAGHDSYHIDDGEGADFFKVGPTLGAGGTGIWRDGRLFRGDNFLEHRIIADGPVRAIFEVQYGAIDANGVRATERKRVSIDAGQHLFRQESTFASDAAELEIAVGLVKAPGLVGSTSRNRAWAWLTTWAPIDPSTHGHGDLGTAVLMDRAGLVDMQETDDHYLAISRVPAGQPLVSWVGAGWTSSRDFDGVEDWWAYVDGFARRLAAPLEVSIQPLRTARP